MKIIKIFGKVVLYGYILSSCLVFVPYYNWQYAKEKGFVRWLFLGEVVSTFKAFTWPYWIMTEIQNNSKRSISHFVKSIEYANESSKMLDGEAPEKMESEEILKIIDFRRRALREAKLVDIKVLNNWYDMFGDNYKDFFIQGLRLSISGFERSDIKTAYQGQRLLERWGIWYSENLEAIKKGEKLIKEKGSSL